MGKFFDSKEEEFRGCFCIFFSGLSTEAMIVYSYLIPSPTSLVLIVWFLLQLLLTYKQKVPEVSLRFFRPLKFSFHQTLNSPIMFKTMYWSPCLPDILTRKVA